MTPPIQRNRGIGTVEQRWSATRYTIVRQTRGVPTCPARLAA